MTQLDDHGTLPAHAEVMLRRLEALAALSVHGDATHVPHVDHAKRARQLAGHLDAILALAEGRRYPSTLALVRVALEHHLMDRLIFLANRYVDTYDGVTKETLAAEEAKLLALQAKRPDLERWWWDDSGMNLVWRGYHSKRSKKGRGLIVSPYYFRVDDFDPFTGGKKQVAELASPFWKKAHRQEWADEAAAMWRRYFVHDKVMKALDANHLLPGRLAMQVDVHYGFLSGYTHPSKRGYEALQGGKDYPGRPSQFDHYASEIALLYVITIAASELEIFLRMARRQPHLGLLDREKTEEEIAAAKSASSYFWFLGGEPQMLDRIDTVHMPSGDEDLKWSPPRRDPRKLRDWEVNYYTDPLRRLVRLHHGWTEMATGVSYVSPFQRDDSRF